MLEKLPLLALALVVSVATLVVQKHVGAVAGTRRAAARCAREERAGRLRDVCVWKTIWPSNLAPFYPFHAYPGWGVGLAALSLAVATGLALAAWRKWPFVTVGWLW